MQPTPATASAVNVVNQITAAFIDPAIALVFAAGLMVFIFGVVEYLYALNVKGEVGGDEGKKHMLWGLVGMFIMLASWAIIKIIDNTLGTHALG
jgi:hypothetical protein